MDIKLMSNPFEQDAMLRRNGFAPEVMGGGQVLWTRHYPEGFDAIGYQPAPQGFEGYIASLHSIDGENMWQVHKPSLFEAIEFLNNAD